MMHVMMSSGVLVVMLHVRWVLIHVGRGCKGKGEMWGAAMGFCRMGGGGAQFGMGFSHWGDLTWVMHVHLGGIM